MKAFLDRGYNVVANSRNITRSGALEASDRLALVDGSIAEAATAAKNAEVAASKFNRSGGFARPLRSEQSRQTAIGEDYSACLTSGRVVCLVVVGRGPGAIATVDGRQSSDEEPARGFPPLQCDPLRFSAVRKRYAPFTSGIGGRVLRSRKVIPIRTRTSR